MKPIPFCIIEKPYVLWSADPIADNAFFLERIDAQFYYRAAHMILNKPDDRIDEDQERKDAASLSRLLWHHGVESMVMLLGAYVQAPRAAHAYFLKCKNKQVVDIARLLLDEKKPKYNRVNSAPFTLKALLLGIHSCAAWERRDITIERFENALRSMLSDFTSDEHRREYNSIKHGLRASHGIFGIAVGIQRTPGTGARDEEMQVIGSSRDASFFDIARPLSNATDEQNRVNFQTEKLGLTWSLERALCELQIISLILHNTVSALRIVGGASPGTVTFNRSADDEAFWEEYFSQGRSSVPATSMRVEIDARQLKLLTDKEVFASYG